MEVLEVAPQSRALRIFEKTIKSDATRVTYRYFLDRYVKFTGKTYEELLTNDPKVIQKDLEDYIIKLGEEKSRAFAKMTFSSLTLFFSMNDVTLNTYKLLRLIPPQQSTARGTLAYSDSDCRKILAAIDKYKRRPRKKARTRALVHFLAASGCRLGAIWYLKVKDIIPIKDCYAVSIYNGTSSVYTTFLTPEAKTALDEYLEEKKANWQDRTVKTRWGTTQIITWEESRVFDMTIETARIGLSRLVRKSGVTNKTQNGRYLIAIAHGFRKRFNTILKSNNSINSSLIEKLMGHSTTYTLDNQYLKPSVERLFEEYEKGITDLTIHKRKEEVVAIPDELFLNPTKPLEPSTENDNDFK